MEETNESAARLGVSFEAYHLRLRIYRSIIDKLNNPKYIKLLVNVEKKRLAITESKRKRILLRLRNSKRMIALRSTASIWSV